MTILVVRYRLSGGLGAVNLQLMRAIIDGFPFATLVLNSAGNVEYWNKTSEQTFGWKSSEVMGRPSPIVPRDRQDEFRAFQELVLNGRTLRAKSLRQRKDGALIEVKATMVPRVRFWSPRSTIRYPASQ